MKSNESDAQKPEVPTLRQYAAVRIAAAMIATSPTTPAHAIISRAYEIADALIKGPVEVGK